MSSPFLAEVTMFGFNFPPKGWAFCQGQILPISQNTALFSLVGTTYGGNGTTTFALPNLQDRTAVSWGQGPGLQNYLMGEQVGVPNVALLTTEIPAHSHFFNATTNQGTTATSSQNQPGMGQAGTKQKSFNANIYSPNPSKATTSLSPSAISISGQSQSHNNMQPYL